MTENSELDDKTLKIIEDVMLTLSKEYNFDIYDSDDIQQEIFIICLKLTKSYTKEKGDLFPFLLGASKNRLISLIRSRYGNSNNKNYKDRMLIVNTAPINDDEYFRSNEEDLYSKYGEYIEEHILPEYKEDFLRMTEGIKILYSKKYEIIGYIKDCMNLTEEFDD